MTDQSYDYCNPLLCLSSLNSAGGSPLVPRPPRVLRNLAPVYDAAGFIGKGIDQTDAPTAKQLEMRRHLEKYDRKVIDDDIADCVRRIKHFLAWVDRDNGSAFDLTSCVDYLTRAIDSKLDNQRKYLLKINAAMRDLERQADNGEFDQEQWRKLGWQKQACIRSGLLFKDMFEAFQIARADTYSRAGREMGSYKSWKTMAKDKDQYHKLKVAEIAADKLVGLTPEEHKVWRKLTFVGALPYMTPEEIEAVERQRDEQNSLAELGGVNIRPDAAGGTARDQQLLRDRQARDRIERLEADAKADAEWSKRYRKRSKARPVPSAASEDEASGGPDKATEQSASPKA